MEDDILLFSAGEACKAPRWIDCSFADRVFFRTLEQKQMKLLLQFTFQTRHAWSFLEYRNINIATELIQSGGIAAVFVEPMQDGGGIYIQSNKGFSQSLCTQCLWRCWSASVLVYHEVRLTLEDNVVIEFLLNRHIMHNCIWSPGVKNKGHFV